MHILASYSPVNLTDNPLAIREVRQTGSVIWMPEVHGWCINPTTSFPLTVVGSDEETAHQIREALDGLVDHYSEDVTEAVAGLAVERGARFYEFEDYLQVQRQTYRAALAATHGKRTERGGHPVEEEIEGEALDALDQCCQDFEVLIEGDYPSDPGELAVIRNFGYGNLLRYLGTGPASVKLVPPGNRRRTGLEALAQAELAIGVDRLSEIPTESLLHAMTVKEIQSLASPPIPSKSRKKDLAVKFVLGQDGIRGTGHRSGGPRFCLLLGSATKFSVRPGSCRDTRANELRLGSDRSRGHFIHHSATGCDESGIRG